MRRLLDNFWYSFVFYYLLFAIANAGMFIYKWSLPARVFCAVAIGVTALLVTAYQNLKKDIP